MPLEEQLYCSQQICIPPTFPYILRQFAKAAIRTQPNDLLKWATTYFRCLSLNIPPPVKPRLEFPIPKDYHGMTPGWLRALVNQMLGNQTISFKTLWDRWIGACLQHNQLIEILCLGGFDDASAIPWNRFIAMCAAHLTDNLTQTMILICEIFTEEPEGGSATITLEMFIDLYQFLARIDASAPQTLRNYYFLDKFLELYQEKIMKDSGVKEEKEEDEGEQSTYTPSESTAETDTGRKDDGSIISCPSVNSQDPDNYIRLLMKLRDEELVGEEVTLEEETPLQVEEQTEPEEEEQDAEKKSSSKKSEDSLMEVEIDEKPKEEPKTFDQQLEEDKDLLKDQDAETSKDTLVKDDIETEEKLDPQKYRLEDEPPRQYPEIFDGEMQYDLDDLEALGLMPVPDTEKILEGVEEEEVPPTESGASEMTTAKESEIEKPEEDEREYEEVDVDAVPGIGGKVPEDMILAVCEYMEKMAKYQHGMVMPRNIRHFECPPLELYYGSKTHDVDVF